MPKFAEFEYTFNISNHIVQYKYCKKSYDDILYEELYIDGDLLILYDKNEQIKTINLKMVMKLTLINYETINH